MVCFKKWTNHVLQVSGESLRYVYSYVKAQEEGWLQNEFQIGSTGRLGSHGQAFPKMPCQSFVSDPQAQPWILCSGSEAFYGGSFQELNGCSQRQKFDAYWLTLYR